MQITKKSGAKSYSEWNNSRKQVQKKDDAPSFAQWKQGYDAENARKAEEAAQAARTERLMQIRREEQAREDDLLAKRNAGMANAQAAAYMQRVNDLQTQIDALDNRPSAFKEPNVLGYNPNVKKQLPEVPDFTLKPHMAEIDALDSMRHNSPAKRMQDVAMQPDAATVSDTQEATRGNALAKIRAARDALANIRANTKNNEAQTQQLPDFALQPYMSTNGVKPEQQTAEDHPKSMMELLAEQTISMGAENRNMPAVQGPVMPDPEEIVQMTIEQQKKQAQEEQQEAKRGYYSSLLKSAEYNKFVAEHGMSNMEEVRGTRPTVSEAWGAIAGKSTPENLSRDLDETELEARWGRMAQNDASWEQRLMSVMTDEEMTLYRYAKSANSKEIDAEEYFELLKPELERRLHNEVGEEQQTLGEEHPVYATMRSVITGPASALGGQYEKWKGLLGAGEINPYGAGYIRSTERDAERSGAKTAIKESKGFADIAGKLGISRKTLGTVTDFVYDTGVSVLGDSMMNTVVMGQGGGLALLGMGASSDKIRQAKLNGASDGQAAILGAVAGAAEIFTEKMRADDLMDLIGKGKQGVLAQLFRNMGSEAMEEGASEIANILADTVVMADESEWEQSIDAYMADGYSYKEAVSRTLGDKAGEVGVSALGGALGGLMSGGGIAITNHTIGQTEQRNAYEADEQARIDALREYGAQGLTLDDVKAQHPEALETMSDYEAQVQLDMGEQVSQTADEAEAPKSRIAQLAQNAADRLLKRSQQTEQQAAQETAQQTQTDAKAQQTTQQTAQQTTQQTTQTAQESTQTQQDKQTQQAQKPATQAQGTAQAQQTKRALEPDVQTVMEANYMGGDRAAYEAAFNRLYAAGEAAVPLQMVQQKAPDVIKAVDAATQQAIWQAGNNAAMTRVTPGVKKLYTSKISREQRGQVRVLEELGKRYNTEFVVVDSLSGANGSYRNGQGRIVVALDAQEGAIVQAAAHELVHYAKDMSEDAYDFLKDNVLETLGKDGLYDLDEAISKRAERYKAQIEGMSEEEKREYLTEEIVAEAVPAIFTNEESVRTMVAKNRTLAEKLRDFFVNFAQNLREIAERYTDRTKHGELAVMMSQDAQTLTEIADMFSAALDVAAEENAQRQENTQTVREEAAQTVQAETEQTVQTEAEQNVKAEAAQKKEVNAESEEFVKELWQAMDKDRYDKNMQKRFEAEMERQETRKAEIDKLQAENPDEFYDVDFEEDEDADVEALEWSKKRAEEFFGDNGGVVAENGTSAAIDPAEAHFSLSEDADISDISDGETVEIPGIQDIKVDNMLVKDMAREAMIKGNAMARVEGQRAATKAINERVRSLLGNAAGRIVRDTKTKMDRAALANKMAELVKQYSLTGMTEETTREATRLAKDVVKLSTKQDNSLRDKYADLRKKLHSSEIYLTETQQQEAANQYGSYGAYRKAMMGTVKIVKDGEGISLDALWSKLSDAAPEIFAPDTNEAQMIEGIATFKELMKPRTVNALGMDVDTAAADLGLRIQADVMAAIGARDSAQELYSLEKSYVRDVGAEVQQQLKAKRRQDAQAYMDIALQLRNAKKKGDATAYKVGMARYRGLVQMSGMRDMIAQAMGSINMQKELTGQCKTARKEITKKAKDLAHRMLHPQKGQRVPTMLQGPVLDVLRAIDVNSEYSEDMGKTNRNQLDWAKTLARLSGVYMKVLDAQNRGTPADGMNGQYLAICEYTVDALQKNIDKLLDGKKELKIGKMNAEELRAVNEILTMVNHTIDTVGRIWSSQRYKTVEEMAKTSMRELQGRKAQKVNEQSALGKARDFAAIDMLEPVSYGERLGTVGQELIGNLMKGEREKFAMIRDAAGYTEKVMKDVGFNGYDIGKWRNAVHTFDIGEGIKMTETQIMSLWLTNRRPQGREHLHSGGMVVANTKGTGLQTANHWLGAGAIDRICSVLTDKQKQAALQMQAYLAGPLAKAGNDVTQRMYLYDAFTEASYWPITSDASALKTEEPRSEAQMSSILNAGFTKALKEKVKNPLIIQDAFDVFARHVNEMASYVAYAETMSDALAWMNYVEFEQVETEDGEMVDGRQITSVKQEVERVVGKQGLNYFKILLQDINGARHGGDNTQLGTLLSNYKAAAVRGKIRVAIQQPTSIVRAAMEMSPKYLIEGLKVRKGTTEEMMEHSSLAWWKANGNYDLGMGKSSDQILWGDTSKAKHVIEMIETKGGLIDPGKFDDWAWTRMWQATKKEIEATTDLVPGTEEYWRAVDDRFCQVMDRTQVVDTVMHRSQLMRSKDMLTKTLTSFQAEPTKTYNMMARAVMDFGREQSKANAVRLWRATQTYVISAAVVAAMTALFDHFKKRDPEDNDDPIWKYIASGKGLEDWESQWGESILDNLNPMSNIPIVQDVWGALNGEEAEITALSGITDLAKAVGTVEDYLNGNSKKRTMYGAVSPLLKAVGQLTGLPVNGMLANTEMMLNAIDPTILRTKQAIQTNADAYEQMYQLTAKGDTKGADKLRAELKKGLYGGTAKSDKEIDSGIADALALNDPRIAEMVELRKTGKDTKKLLALKKEVMADGFSDAIVTRATNVLLDKKEGKFKDEYMALYEQTQIPWYERDGWTKQETLEARMRQMEQEGIAAGITTADDIKKWKAEKNVDKQLEVGSSSVTKLFSNEDLLASVTGGSTSDVKTTFDYLVSVSDAKEPEKGIQSALTKNIKPMYIEAVEKGKTKEAQKIAQNLIAIGYTQDKIDAWVKDDVTDRYKDKYVASVRAGKDASAAAKKLLAAGQTQDTLDGWVKSAYYGDIWDAVLAGDMENAGKLIREAKSKTGVETKNIVSSLNSKISKEYTELMAAGKTREAERLAQNAYSLGLTKKDGTNYYGKTYFDGLLKK